MGLQLLLYTMCFGLLLTISMPTSMYGQENAIQTRSMETYCGTDPFGFHYGIDGPIFFKTNETHRLQFSDFQLGIPDQASIINPLKIVLTYRDSNTIVILDRYLNEIDRVAFNGMNPLNTMTHAALASPPFLWIFDRTEQRLELYDPSRNRSTYASKPILETIVDLSGTMNHCWILTPTRALQFNAYGSQLNSIEHSGFNAVKTNSKNTVFQHNNKVYLIKAGKDSVQQLPLTNVAIKNLHLTNEVLYIYDGRTLASHPLSNL